MRLFCQFRASLPVLMALGTPVTADVTAAYSVLGSSRQSLTLEVSDNGDMRITGKQGMLLSYTLFSGGQIYEVSPGPGHPTVTTLAAATELARRDREYSATSFEDINLGGLSPDTPRRTPERVVSGTRQIAGFPGILYEDPGSSQPELTQVVLSEDPKLLPLGPAFAAYNEAMEALQDPGLTSEDNLGPLLANHGVLALWPYTLTSVSFEPIDDSRFALPAKPIDVKDLAPPEPQETAAQPDLQDPQPFVLQAEFSEGALLTLLSDGRLLSWPEGAERGTEVSTPGAVAGFCSLDAKVLLATFDPDHPAVQIWSGSAGGWSLLMQLPISADDPFLALDCSGPQPLVLTALSLRIGDETRPISLPEEGLSLGGMITTLQAGGFLYVGVNVGEWGGGLLRFPLGGGRGIYIDASDPTTPCGGLLNKQCHPITGLAVDPANVDCILASMGLNHMMATGAVLRICGQSIFLAYAKPYTLDPNWRFNPKDRFEDMETVAFHSLAGSATGVWAVANDGTYLFTTGSKPDFFPFPPSSSFSSGVVDWSNPEFILISTSMNARFSVGGESLILVPRPAK